MSVKAKESGETRLVWRVTAENPNGELLELVPKAASPRDRKSRKVVWTRVPAAPPDGPLGARPIQAPEPEAAPRPVARATGPEQVGGWQASSWDLLNGLSVSDLSDKMPARTFDALFSANEASARPSGRKQR